MVQLFPVEIVQMREMETRSQGCAFEEAHQTAGFLYGSGVIKTASTKAASAYGPDIGAAAVTGIPAACIARSVAIAT